MANPSKRYPWVVEAQLPNPNLPGWYAMAAYRDKDEALMQAALMTKRAPEMPTRVVEWTPDYPRLDRKEVH